MQVNTSNDVKVYNLSAGKSLPNWISDRKRRQLEKSDISIRRRIELIQVSCIVKGLSNKYRCLWYLVLWLLKWLID